MKPHRPSPTHGRHVAREGIAASPGADRPQSHYLSAEARLRNVFENFQKAASMDLDIEQIASLFHVSYAHLTRLLKRAGLPPPMRQIRLIHLREAARRLEHETVSLEALAEEFGYANATSLRRAFRRLLAKSVTELRKHRGRREK